MQYNNSEYVVLDRSRSTVAINRVLRKTYFLLSSTVLFSALVAVAILKGILPFVVNPVLTLVGMFGLLFLTSALAARKSKWALLSIFAFTGFMGATLAPLSAYYMTAYINGTEIVQMSLVGTGVIFSALSLYAVVSHKNFSYMGGFLFVGFCVALLASIASMFLQWELLSVLVSCAFVLLSSGLILFRTSQIVNGGEDNYIMATISLYVSLYNLFISLLHVLSFFSGRKS